MPTATIDAAGEEVGPVQGRAGVLALSGTMTAGGIIVMVRPQGSDTYYPSAFITAAIFQQVPNEAGDGYGFVHGFQIPGGGDAKAVASSAFEGDLMAEIRFASPSDIAAGAAGLGVLGDTAAVPVAQGADPDLTVVAGLATSWDIAIAASATTDGMDVTCTAKDANGVTVTGVRRARFWVTEDATALGLTATTPDSIAIGTGELLAEITADVQYEALTDENGVLVFTVVDSDNPADQYIAVERPIGGVPAISEVSGTNWEGV